MRSMEGYLDPPTLDVGRIIGPRLGSCSTGWAMCLSLPKRSSSSVEAHPRGRCRLPPSHARTPCWSGWVVLLPGVQGYGWVQKVGLVDVPCRCPSGVGPSLVGHVDGEGCAGRGRRPGDIRWRGGVVLRYWCSSCSARAAPLSDRPRHTRCWRESSSISDFDRYGPRHRQPHCPSK